MAPRHLHSTRRILGMALAAVGLFLIVAPFVEQSDNLATLEHTTFAEGEIAALDQALRELCWTHRGNAKLRQALRGFDRQRRLEILARSEAIGCLADLPASLRAEYLLFGKAAEPGIHARLLRQGIATLEPAIDALGSTQASVRQRAIEALHALQDDLSDDQRQRVLRYLRALPASGSRDDLMRDLGAAPPLEAPAAKPQAPPQHPAPRSTSRQPSALGLELRLDPELDLGILERDLTLEAPVLEFEPAPAPKVIWRRQDRAPHQPGASP